MGFLFQILTQEDWNVVLYNGMASTSPWASLYFVALMTFGNYVLFNLLVAILVEGFQAEVSCCSNCFRRTSPFGAWQIGKRGPERAFFNLLPFCVLDYNSHHPQSTGPWLLLAGKYENCNPTQVEHTKLNDKTCIHGGRPLQRSSACPWH